jgi:glycosidase
MEKKDPNSILNYYRQLLAMRHTNKALLEGNYIPLNENDPSVLSYMRGYKGQNVIVVLNMSGVAQKVSLNLASKGVHAKSVKTLLSSFTAPSQLDPAAISVAPFGAWIGETE